MARKSTTLRIDEQAIYAFKSLAKKSNMSFPRYLETLMIKHAKDKGEISLSYELLGETRGGDRTSNRNDEGGQ